MNQGSSKLLDEFAKLLTDAAGLAKGVKGEADTILKSQAQRLFNEMDLVRRDEFDAVKAMASKAREENEALKVRIEALEKMVSGK